MLKIIFLLKSGETVEVHTRPSGESEDAAAEKFSEEMVGVLASDTDRIMRLQDAVNGSWVVVRLADVSALACRVLPTARY